MATRVARDGTERLALALGNHRRRVVRDADDIDGCYRLLDEDARPGDEIGDGDADRRRAGPLRDDGAVIQYGRHLGILADPGRGGTHEERAALVGDRRRKVNRVT